MEDFHFIVVGYKDLNWCKDESILDIGRQAFHDWNNCVFEVVGCDRYLLGTWLCLHLRDEVSDIGWMDLMQLNLIQC